VMDKQRAICNAAAYRKGCIIITSNY